MTACSSSAVSERGNGARPGRFGRGRGRGDPAGQSSWGDGVVDIRRRRRLERLYEYGVDYGIDYTTQDVPAEVMRLTDGRGADLVVDPIGGRTLEGSIACAAYRGRISWMGNAGGATAPPNIWPLMEKNGTVTTIFFAMEQSRQPERTYAVVSRAIERLGRGELKAVVDRLFALSDAADAHRYVETGQAFGRVVMVPQSAVCSIPRDRVAGIEQTRLLTSRSPLQFHLTVREVRHAAGSRAGDAGQGAVPRLRATGAAARRPRPARRGAESGAGLRHADPAGTSGARVLGASGGTGGSAGPQGVRADPCGPGAGQRVAGGGELAQTRPGRVPSQAGRRRGGEARRPTDDRRRAAPRAVAPAARRPAGGDDRAGRPRTRCCCWRVLCCACRPTCAGWRYASSAGPCAGVDRERHPQHTRAARPRLAEALRPGGRPGAGGRWRRPRCRRRRVGGGDGAQRLREVDAASSPRRAGPRLGWGGVARRAPHRPARREGPRVCGGATSGSCSRPST